MAKVGIVGCGFVGEATAKVIELAGNEVVRHDPPKGVVVENWDDCSVIFFCVPTDDHDLGFHLLFSVVEEVALKWNHPGGALVIRSTVAPGTTNKVNDLVEKLRGKGELRVCYMPEFLREKSALQDAMDPDKLIIGYVSNDLDNCLDIIPLFGDIAGSLIKRGRVFSVPAMAAETAKLMLNALGLLKVAYANEIFDYCLSRGIDYGHVFNIISLDRNINPRHLNVLCDGYRGASGKCLPKDSAMLLREMRSMGLPSSVLAAGFTKNQALLEGRQQEGAG